MAAAMGEHVKCPSKDVQKLLTRYPVLVYQGESNKVKCSLSSHEMPCKADAILSYVSGKKFLKLYKDKEFGYERYAPHLVPSIKKRQEHLLYCNLTLRHINKTPQDVERHVNGKKYKKALKRWHKCQESGEAFKPLGRKRNKELATSDGQEPDFLNSEEETIKSDSDMSDLYPDEDFGSLEEEEMEKVSDSNSEESDVESQKNVPNASLSNKAVTNKAEDSNSDVQTKDHSKSKKAQMSTKRTKTQKKKKRNKSKPL